MQVIVGIKKTQQTQIIQWLQNMDNGCFLCICICHYLYGYSELDIGYMKNGICSHARKSFNINCNSLTSPIKPVN